MASGIHMYITVTNSTTTTKIKRTSGVAEPLPSPPVPLPCRIHGTIFFFFFWQNGDLYVPFFLYSSFNAFLRSSLVTLDRTATTWWPFLHSQLATLSSSATRQAASEFLLKPAGGGWVDGLFDPHPKWLQQQMGAWIGWCSLFYLGKKKKKKLSYFSLLWCLSLGIAREWQGLQSKTLDFTRFLQLPLKEYQQQKLSGEQGRRGWEGGDCQSSCFPFLPCPTK